MNDIIALLLCTSALGMVTFMWITMLQDRDKSIRIAASFMFIPLIIGLLLIICGGIMEMINT